MKCCCKKSEVIRFKKGLPQGDALSRRLFTLCLSPIAWKLRATEVYKLSKAISSKVTDLLYIDDLKIYAAPEDKLKRVMADTEESMEDIGIQWNLKKCHVARVKINSQVNNT